MILLNMKLMFASNLSTYNPISVQLVFVSFYMNVYERKYLDASSICLLVSIFDKTCHNTFPGHLKASLSTIPGCASLDTFSFHVT